MLVWGSAGKSSVVGDAGIKNCNVCGQNRPFQYVVNYTMRHVWYLIRWSTGRTYSQFCTVCNYGLPAEKAHIDAQNLTGDKRPDPIPFFDRMGWAIGLGVLALFVVMIVIAGNAGNKEDAKMVAAPKVGDLYTVDVDKFLPKEALSSDSIGGDFGVFRVAEVKDGQVTLDVPKVIYSRLKGVHRDISSGEVKEAGYYDGQMLQPVDSLMKFQQNGTINDVDRE